MHVDWVYSDDGQPRAAEGAAARRAEELRHLFYIWQFMCNSVVLLPVGAQEPLQKNDRSHAEDRDGVLLDYHFFYLLCRVL